MTTPNTTASAAGSRDDDEMQLPGFRFHPTDEEIVGFYLRRKVDKKPIKIDIIKQIDIYKHDPWDLPKIISTLDKEGYFFCKRGRKYRNSIRPNRVTGSGFWKATGIDKPVYSQGGEGRECIGLKKTLVYYRGSAGRGTKTDWMMHEFRLPPKDSSSSNAITTLQEAEVWTICRIFKRTVSHRKYTADWRESSSSAQRHSVLESNSKTCTMESKSLETYISFEAPIVHQTNYKQMKPVVDHHHIINNERNRQYLAVEQLSYRNQQQQFIALEQQLNYNVGLDQLSSSIVHSPSMASSSSFQNPHGNELFTYENWDELRSVVEFAFDSSPPR